MLQCFFSVISLSENNKAYFMKFCNKQELKGKSDTKKKVRKQAILPMNKQPRNIPKVKNMMDEWKKGNDSQLTVTLRYINGLRYQRIMRLILPTLFQKMFMTSVPIRGCQTLIKKSVLQCIFES